MLRFQLDRVSGRYGELLKLGIDIGETSVSKYLCAVENHRHKPGEPSLRTIAKAWCLSTFLWCRRSGFRSSMYFWWRRMGKAHS
jgi:hypothetical protein